MTDKSILLQPPGPVIMDVGDTTSRAVGISTTTGPHVESHALISISAGADATGIFATDFATDTGTLVNNIGDILVTSRTGVAIGIQAQGPHDVVNSGGIDVTGFQGAIGAFLGPGTSLVNSGQITAHDMPGATGAIAVQYSPDQAWSFNNSGTVSGDFALKALGGVSASFGATIGNTGHMFGAIALGGGADTLVNSGTIAGPTDLGDGNDLYDGRLGAETGLVSGGAGADTELGGVGFDNLQGNQGDDSLSGGGGDDIVVGGKDNDVQFGDAGNDVVWGNLGNDTVDGGDGNDQVRGGQGDDSVSGGAGDDFVSGDRGNDTISGGAGADLFHGSQDAGIDKVLDFHLAEGDRVMLDPGTTYTVSQVGADTVIDMGAGNEMILVGVQLSSLTAGWVFGG
jgi:Ca2+-binding RTX toxin-like protein